MNTPISSTKEGKLGTLPGVFIPNILQMMGVVFFLKMGEVLGSVGLTKMCLVIALCSSLLLITSLSLSAITTNMKIKGSGAYYIISRILGVEFGSAIGFLLCIAQHATIALSVAGLAFSFCQFFPQFSPFLAKTMILAFIALLSIVSASTAIRIQMFIAIVLGGSFLSIFSGAPLEGGALEEGVNGLVLPFSFWAAFALFFPATTGIETGMGFSGDLKNPSRSLPIGTIASVLVAFCLYISMAFFLSSHTTPSQMVHQPLIMSAIARFEPLVIGGIWGAFLSSALSNFLGASRTLQSLATDRVLPPLFAQGLFSRKGEQGRQPFYAYCFVYLASFFLVSFIGIDRLIPFLAMIFLASYGLINFVAFFEAFLKNPSWRPQFAIFWPIPLCGCLGCLVFMLMINVGAALIVLTLAVLFCLFSQKRKLSTDWDDIRHSLLSLIVQKGAAYLKKLNPNPMSWRPHLLTLFDQLSQNTLHFSHALDQGQGFLTFASSVLSNKKEIEEPISKLLEDYDIPAFVHITETDNRLNGIKQIIQSYGYGPLKPNTLLIPLENKIFTPHFLRELIEKASDWEKNVFLLKNDPNVPNLYALKGKKTKQINLWWRGGNQRNFELSLALALALRKSPVWEGAKICIKSIVDEEKKGEKLQHVFERTAKRNRVEDLTFDAVIDKEENFFKDLVGHSSDADLTLLGLRTPRQGEGEEEYATYLKNLFIKSDSVSNVGYVLAGENLPFHLIFR